MIRKAEVSDIDKVFEISEDSIIHGWSRESLLSSMSKPLYDFFVYQEDKIMGFVQVMKTADGSEIINLAVHPDFRRIGIASKLIDSISLYPIFLEVRRSNIPAITLYEKAGFKKIAERKKYYHAPEEDAVVMKKTSA